MYSSSTALSDARVIHRRGKKVLKPARDKYEGAYRCGEGGESA